VYPLVQSSCNIMLDIMKHQLFELCIFQASDWQPPQQMCAPLLIPPLSAAANALEPAVCDNVRKPVREHVLGLGNNTARCNFHCAMRTRIFYWRLQLLFPLPLLINLPRSNCPS
jgi:hypothetical protein